MAKRDKLIGELEKRTISLLQEHSYHVRDNSIWRGGYLGFVGNDGTVEIRYSSIDALDYQLELRNLLQANSIGYQEEGLSKVKEALTKKLNHITEILKKSEDTS